MRKIVNPLYSDRLWHTSQSEHYQIVSALKEYVGGLHNHKSKAVSEAVLLCK